MEPTLDDLAAEAESELGIIQDPAAVDQARIPAVHVEAIRPAIVRLVKAVPWDMWAKRTGDDRWKLDDEEADGIAEPLSEIVAAYLPAVLQNPALGPWYLVGLAYLQAFGARYLVLGMPDPASTRKGPRVTPDNPGIPE